MTTEAFGNRWFAMAGRGRGWHGHGPPFGRGGFPFGPFFLGGPGGFPRGPRARRGDVRAAALILLAEEPRNGYQLMQEIEQRSGGVCSRCCSTCSRPASVISYSLTSSRSRARISPWSSSWASVG